MLRDNERRGQTAYAIFLAVTIFSLAYAVFNIAFAAQLASFSPDGMNTPRLQAFGLINQLALVVNLGLLLASAVSFIRWARRAYYNLGAIGVDTSFSDASVVYAWILPVTSLYRPYQLVREIWQLTQREAFGHIRSHTLLRVWWASFLTRSVLGIVVSAIGNGMTLESLRTAMQFQALSLAFDGFAALITARVIHRIMQFEQQLVLVQNVTQLGQAPPEPAALSPTDPDLYL
ncbi:DUF4328 domain-containing protein [Hymenobacter rigui]|uniref:DUF4328 domain-containing protein n=1 Tax=Hymenobacter rigui TaxID=334424 RepID=A0A3R9N3A3_9BACT|nr:DUF4328 domain-containing protein [Hymenobacter rigui]RSK47164.1 DUF4328 domain-containing protein [Hymenobacter rigui]